MKDQTTGNLLDPRFHLPSYEQYLLDNETYHFTKMSMTEVMNADMMIATFGEEQYYQTCSEILGTGNAAYVHLGLDQIIKVYIHSYKYFIAVANDAISDEDFLNLMKGFYAQYELSRAQQTDLGGVSRFVLVFGDHLFDRGKAALHYHRHEQKNFLIASDEREKLLAQREQNVEIFQLLDYAISHDLVVPFYQGIYDNQTGGIHKYETLMRVYDKEGNLCPPGKFLPIAKKLKLYLTLSKITIEKALKDFAGRPYDLGLNISLLDVQSEEFCDWFVEQVKVFPDPSRLVLEFVETENYNHNQELVDFLTRVRALGCRIAVDDFGVGFATYSSIVSLKPDIIKVDGDIIKNLATDQDSVMILQSICYMANLIGAAMTAEFVENEAIQAVVTAHQIRYSQGYLFAKPEPFEALSLSQ